MYHINITIFLKLILREIDEEMTEDELDEIITEVSYFFVLEILDTFWFAD